MKQVYFNIAYSNMTESSLLLTGKKYVSLITDYIKQNTNRMISSFSIVCIKLICIKGILSIITNVVSPHVAPNL